MTLEWSASCRPSRDYCGHLTKPLGRRRRLLYEALEYPFHASHLTSEMSASSHIASSFTAGDTPSGQFPESGCSSVAPSRDACWRMKHRHGTTLPPCT